MSFVAALVVLLSLVALANADCAYLINTNTATLSSTSSYNLVSYGGTATLNCLPGYVYDTTGTTSTTFTCGTASTSVSSNYYSCAPIQNYCPTTINSGFLNTKSLSSGKYPQYTGAQVNLFCNGRNVKGNGTVIQVTCSSDGSQGVWTSPDWCSGALGVSANLALLALAAVAGLLYKRLF